VRGGWALPILCDGVDLFFMTARALPTAFI
jgi:hypothetical protein